MNVVMACQKDYNMETGESARTGSYYFNVGGQLQFNHSGDSGFIRFNLSEVEGGGLWPSGTGYTKFDPHAVGNLGGLSGKGVFAPRNGFPQRLTSISYQIPTGFFRAASGRALSPVRAR